LPIELVLEVMVSRGDLKEHRFNHGMTQPAESATAAAAARLT